MIIPRLEASVVYAVCTQLENLGWTVDEKEKGNNVTQQRVKTETQQDQLRKQNGNLKFPDFVLYEKGSTTPIAVIEAKRPGESLAKAMKQAKERYAKPLNAPLIFAYNDTFVETSYLHNSRPLKIDGEDIRQFIDHYTSLRFVHEGPEILSAPQNVQVSREELIRIFKRQANLLREAGLQAGLERFGAFSDVLFLKLMDELCQIKEHAGGNPLFPQHLRWSEFQDKNPEERIDYVRDVVWQGMNDRYGEIFSHAFPITSPEIFDDMVQDLSNLNFTGTDVDVKGDAFEYFLKNAYQGIKIKDLGEYFTPRNIVRTMVSMVAPQIGEKIYDPFCGTGGFLIEAFRYISLRTKATRQTTDILQSHTIYGSEITVTARVAKMNMILYGDGHSNVMQQDSFANPRKDLYDIVLTNPPYSQATRHGNLYDIPSSSGDAVSIQHCIDSLKPDGRAAILVKEDFLTEGGDIGKVRDVLLNTAKNFSIVSLPRRLFEPYTPTKTSIIYFEKQGIRDSTFFFVVQNVGYTFGARKKSLPGNELPEVLSSFNNDEADTVQIDHAIIQNDTVKQSKNSLWIYDYVDIIPPNVKHPVPLGNHIHESGEVIAPAEQPDEQFDILGVSNTIGVFHNETKYGADIKQKYVIVDKGDLVYNPHRVNVGSIGIVPEELAGGIISNIYVIFRSSDPERLPPAYLLRLLKSKTYLSMIRAYDSKHGAVRANLNWEQLCRMKIQMPTAEQVSDFTSKQSRYTELEKQMKDVDEEINVMLEEDNSNPNHLEDFNEVIRRAVTPAKPPQT